MVESSAAKRQEQSRETDHTSSGLEGLFARISIADGVYLLILCAGGILRLVGLGETLLSPAEARHALASWEFLQAGMIDVAVASPAYNTLTGLLMYFLGATDVTARLVPALFGIGLIMLPWLLRRPIGMIGVTATALLFAASPLLAAVSRTAGGEAIALFAVLLLCVSAIRLRNHEHSRWIYVLGGAIGLGITSAPLFYSGLTTLLIAWLAQRLLAPGDHAGNLFDRRTLPKAFVAAAVVAFALSTRFLSYPSGIGAAGQILADWLSQFSTEGGLQELVAPFVALGRYESLLLLLGLLAVIWAVWRNHQTGTFFTYWLFTLLILMLLQRGTLANAAILTLPGYLLLGLVSQSLLQTGLTRFTWVVFGVMTMAGAIALVNIARFLRVSLVEQQVANLWIAMMALAGAILFLYYFWSEKQRAVLQGTWLGILFLLLLYHWGTAWNLTHTSMGDPRENWITEATDNDIRYLVQSLQEISRTASNSATDIPLFSALDSPVLRWYLRDFDQTQFGQSIPPAAGYEVIISPASTAEPVLGSDYLGADFGLLLLPVEEAPSSTTPLLDGLRWLLFHESELGFREERVILWVRSDLVGAP